MGTCKVPLHHRAREHGGVSPAGSEKVWGDTPASAREMRKYENHTRFGVFWAVLEVLEICSPRRATAKVRVGGGEGGRAEGAPKARGSRKFTHRRRGLPRPRKNICYTQTSFSSTNALLTTPDNERSKRLFAVFCRTNFQFIKAVW